MNEYSKNIQRRHFLELGISSATAFCMGCGKSEKSDIAFSSTNFSGTHEASFYEKLQDNYVQCHLQIE